MINQQILEYIKQQLQLGVSREQIKSSLMTNGWSLSDIEEGFNAIGSAPSTIPHAPFLTPNLNMSAKKNGSLLTKIILSAMVVVLAGAGWFAFKYFNSSKIDQQTEIPVVGQEVNQTPSTSTQVTSNPDIAKVKIVLEDIRQGYLTGNEALVVKHMSTETAKFFASSNSGFKPVSNFTIGDVSPLGENILANIISSESTLTGPMIFIKEGGDWKLDLTATFKYAMDQNDAKKGTGVPTGLPDLVVTGVVVYPSHPVVNSKDVQITVTIKNVGTKTSDGGAPLVASLLGFAKETPVQGGNLVPLTPGETVTWNFHPYDKNDFFKVSDTPGQKTIQIVLNKDREIVESKYDNNVFTQAVQMYSN